jgi:hypothetical protein
MRFAREGVMALSDREWMVSPREYSAHRRNRQ